MTLLRAFLPNTEMCSALKNCIFAILSLSAQALILCEAPCSRADIVLIDVRSDTRLGRCLPELLAGQNKTVVVLIAVSNDIFALTRMGSFSGRDDIQARTGALLFNHRFYQG